MPLSDLHRQVAAIALGAAGEHGFALGGGNALLAHGIISRPTQDVDLFTNQEHGVEAAADTVEAALRSAGFEPGRRYKAGGLADIFPGMGEGLAEWIVTAPGGKQMMLQMSYFDRGREPVVMEVGPVLDLEDVVGGKVCALASRIEPRDYADTAAALKRYSPAQLISFARRLDPGLTGRDFAEAALRLDEMEDEAFTAIGLSQEDVTALRERFTAWPRDPEAAGRELQAGKATEQGPGQYEGEPAPGAGQHQHEKEPLAGADWGDSEPEL
jgi:Nucleotidyl transferase AbiEii toxin, Type IV TA system